MRIDSEGVQCLAGADRGAAPSSAGRRVDGAAEAEGAAQPRGRAKERDDAARLALLGLGGQQADEPFASVG